MPEQSNQTTRIIRLKTRADFLRVQRAGRKWATPGLVLQTREWPCSGQGESKAGVGFTTSEKGWKRRGTKPRAATPEGRRGHRFPEFAAPHRNFVVVGRRGTLRRPWKKLLEDLKTALKRLDGYRKTHHEEVSRD